VPKLESFNPVTCLEFIIAIFKPHADIQTTKIEYETVKATDLEEAFNHNHNRMLMA
jgi:hypothetical protein